ncbi:hypothetical protein [Amycolatopsis sp.]|jgi:hypothetical protein|uniref:hypothetical protein n=1 Tax=Amycolatopsis sp. TaxID=37632 RepID=UPI002DFB589A|nr:hypothetical protein [Amycolatopsis sp.]
MKLRPDAVDIGAMDIDDVDTILVDCDRCEVRGDACTDCVISVLFGAPPVAEWDVDEQRAIDALIAGGLVPGLRLLPMVPGAERPESRPLNARRRPA